LRDQKHVIDDRVAGAAEFFRLEDKIRGADCVLKCSIFKLPPLVACRVSDNWMTWQLDLDTELGSGRGPLSDLEYDDVRARRNVGKRYTAGRSGPGCGDHIACAADDVIFTRGRDLTSGVQFHFDFRYYLCRTETIFRRVVTIG